MLFNLEVVNTFKPVIHEHNQQGASIILNTGIVSLLEMVDPMRPLISQSYTGEQDQPAEDNE